jgi:hypothetical protein
MVNATPRSIYPFTPEKENPYPSTGGGWLGLRADLDTQIYLQILSNVFVIVFFADINVYYFKEVNS